MKKLRTDSRRIFICFSCRVVALSTSPAAKRAEQKSKVWEPSRLNVSTTRLWDANVRNIKGALIFIRFDFFWCHFSFVIPRESRGSVGQSVDAGTVSCGTSHVRASSFAMIFIRIVYLSLNEIVIFFCQLVLPSDQWSMETGRIMRTRLTIFNKNKKFKYPNLKKVLRVFKEKGVFKGKVFHC